jgi:tetratricopeptide (TPR) repeat protein
MHHAIGMARFQLGDLVSALDNTDAALTAARGIDDAALEALCLQQMGGVLNAMGDHAASKRYFEAALSTAAAIGDEIAELRALMGLAAYHFETGDYASAGEQWTRALDIAERVGSHRNARITHGYLGFLHFDLGNLELSAYHVGECVRRSRAVGDARIEGTFEGLRGAVLAEQNRLAEAEAAFTAAKELLANNRYFSELVALYEGHLDVARARLAASLDDQVESKAHLAGAMLRIAVAEGGDSPLVKRSDDARIAIRILRRAIMQLR